MRLYALVKSSQPKPDLQFSCWNKNGLREIGKALIVLVAIQMRLPAVVALPKKKRKKRMLFEPIEIMDY